MNIQIDLQLVNCTQPTTYFPPSINATTQHNASCLQGQHISMENTRNQYTRMIYKAKCIQPTPYLVAYQVS